jgi:hypothetical protein
MGHQILIEGDRTKHFFGPYQYLISYGVRDDSEGTLVQILARIIGRI